MKTLCSYWDDDVVVIYQRVGEDSCGYMRIVFKRATIEATFRQRNSFLDVQSLLHVSARATHRLLGEIGITFTDVIQSNWHSKWTVRRIAEFHGSSSKHVSDTLKLAGINVPNGNQKRKQPSKNELTTLWATEPSINCVAKRLGVHWNTAQRWLSEYRLIDNTAEN